jgi:hypothetical protein
VLVALLVVAFTAPAHAELFGGIEFPDGESSFADEVLNYDPLYSGGPGPTNPFFVDPNEAIGAPNFPPGGGGTVPGAVSLGRGGLIELLFADNLLTNSGDDQNDLHIFEVGSDIEDTFVAVRPTGGTEALLGPAFDADGDGFYEVGKVLGATSSIDIDAFFPGFGPGELLFDAVQLIDDPNEGGTSGSTPGADIDAVGAIASEPATMEVVVDIKPGSCPNPLNLKSRGVLPVAVLGTLELDVNDIDPASIRLEGVAPLRSALKDVAAPVTDTNDCNCMQPGPDGQMDLTLKFKRPLLVQALMLAYPEIAARDVLTLNLTGELSNGISIEGADCIVIVGKVPDDLGVDLADVNKDGKVNLGDMIILRKHFGKSTTGAD